MKKILSLLTAVTILLTSVVVEAAFSVEEYYGDNFLMISPVETGADILARQPRLSVVKTEVITASAAETAGIALGSGRTKMSDANADFYKVTYKIDNIGDLYVAYSDATDYVHSVKLLNVAITLAGLTTKGAVSSSTFGGVAWTVANNQMQWTCGANSNSAYPTTLNTSSGDKVSDTEIELIVFYAVAKGTTYNAAPSMTFTYGQREGAYDEGIEGYAWGDTESRDVVATGANSLVFPPAPATVDVTSVTISGATAATVGDNVSLTATVLPDNATDKTVTWTKVSGNGAVSDSGVVTATAAGDVVVKATAGGVDSANYTVSFAAAAPADIVPAAADKDTYSNASTGLKDAFGKDVTIDSSRSYGAAKFDNVVLDDGEYVYKVFATGINKATGLEETKSWDVVDGSVEITGANVSFIAIVRSATHTITSVVLKAFAK